MAERAFYWIPEKTSPQSAKPTGEVFFFEIYGMFSHIAGACSVPRQNLNLTVSADGFRIYLSGRF